MAEQQLLAGEPVGGANKSLLLRRTSGEIIASFGWVAWQAPVSRAERGGGINEHAFLSCSFPHPLQQLQAPSPWQAYKMLGKRSYNSDVGVGPFLTLPPPLSSPLIVWMATPSKACGMRHFMKSCLGRGTFFPLFQVTRTWEWNFREADKLCIEGKKRNGFLLPNA